MGCEHCEEALGWMHCVLSIFKKNNMNVYVIWLRRLTLFTIAFKECFPRYKLYRNIPPWSCRCSRSLFLFFCLLVFFLELLTTFFQLWVDVFLLLQKIYKKIDNLNMCAHLSKACYSVVVRLLRQLSTPASGACMNGLGYSGLLQIKYDIRLFREDALLSPCSGSNWWKPYNIILDHDTDGISYCIKNAFEQWRKR